MNEITAKSFKNGIETLVRRNVTLSNVIQSITIEKYHNDEWMIHIL